jgi:hypothetical protein
MRRSLFLLLLVLESCLRARTGDTTGNQIRRKRRLSKAAA